jgi:hypothetical protein
MTKLELEEKIKKANEDHEHYLKSIMRDYCNANNPYKVGDKFTDHIGSIIIERMNYSYGSNPCCIYFGLDLKKDGTPTKKGTKRNAWQSNEIK